MISNFKQTHCSACGVAVSSYDGINLSNRESSRFLCSKSHWALTIQIFEIKMDGFREFNG
jgi:hypothetical protein